MRIYNYEISLLFQVGDWDGEILVVHGLYCEVGGRITCTRKTVSSSKLFILYVIHFQTKHVKNVEWL